MGQVLDQYALSTRPTERVCLYAHSRGCLTSFTSSISISLVLLQCCGLSLCYRHTAMKHDRDASQRNLYVLNLPLDVSVDQFGELFRQHGKVSHAVILATLDSLARRRGFILMSSNKEAVTAIQHLDGYLWHGYRIEVSYAIVQRSGAPIPPASSTEDKRLAQPASDVSFASLLMTF